MIKPGPLWTDAETRALAPKLHCFLTMQFLYGDPIARMTSPDGLADLAKWRRLGCRERSTG